ncbi:spore germination protein [Paenibacillus sp. UNC451MF]|uniref:spore germination protein n=1 Tax=Paenibacillus sp. UNC451MF TaxID=1449063 RepID=UPI00068C1E90|nr:spore germination protein [Paenibacillus sp. UNC451MF]
MTNPEKNATKLSVDLNVNINHIENILGFPSDLIIKEFKVGGSHSCAIVCIDGLVNRDLISEQILKSMLIDLGESNKIIPVKGDEFVSFMRSELLPMHAMVEVFMMNEVLSAVLSGDTVLLIHGSSKALVIGTKGWKSRGIEEPQTEALIRGPRDGFTEDICTTTSLIRRRLPDPNLRFDTYKIGERIPKEVIVAYIEGIVNPKLVDEVKRRLVSIKRDDTDGSGFIEQWIMDNFMSPFPQILNTERPDKVSTALLQGRVAVLVDGTPFQLIMPISFVSSFHSPEDLYQNWMISSLIRFLRIAAAFMTTFLPALYIALTEFHHGMLPSKLAFSIAGAREGVPFPAVVEAFMMEGTLELLREAGIRLPKPIGQTIGIVGGLVIGEAAVSAGIVSPIMVIVVAITAISSFTLPTYSFAISLRMIRFAVMLAAGIFGIYGIVLAYIIISIHIVNLKSFGLPYSTPVAPMFIKDWKQVLMRVPVTQLDNRLEMLETQDKKRT